MMTAALLLVCLVLTGAVIALVRTLRHVETRLAALEAAARAEPPRRASRDQVATAPGGGVVPDAGAPVASTVESDFLITRLGQEPDPDPVPMMEPRLFADVVLRESVVKAASWAHGVRTGLSPANRNRIWFEMRREVRRARKERKAEEREAIREWRARKRAAVRTAAQEESAA